MPLVGSEGVRDASASELAVAVRGDETGDLGLGPQGRPVLELPEAQASLLRIEGRVTVQQELVLDDVRIVTLLQDAGVPVTVSLLSESEQRGDDQSESADDE